MKMCQLILFLTFISFIEEEFDCPVKTLITLLKAWGLHSLWLHLTIYWRLTIDLGVLKINSEVRVDRGFALLWYIYWQNSQKISWPLHLTKYWIACGLKSTPRKLMERTRQREQNTLCTYFEFYRQRSRKCQEGYLAIFTWRYNTIMVKTSASKKNFYRPHPKDGEGNVFHFVHTLGGGVRSVQPGGGGGQVSPARGWVGQSSQGGGWVSPASWGGGSVSGGGGQHLAPSCGQYASCIHAGGLSCCFLFLACTSQWVQQSLIRVATFHPW